MEQAHTQLIAQLNERILAADKRRFILSLPKR
ncbi:GntR family transcriptional regulator [Escherichia coli]|nr:GntR family transcriptional regulator [Escherichia coli]